MSVNLLLAGVPNCGKTTLFNLLTGKNERVGNRAGVSVEEKRGRYKNNKSITVTDLPGTYSLTGGGFDQRVAATALSNSPEAIVNVVNGLNLERDLMLTAELIFLKAPMVVAINFADEMERSGVKIDLAALSKAFGVPFILISARRGTGVKKLMDLALRANVPAPAYKDAFFRPREFISKTLKTALTEKAETCAKFSEKADKVLLNRFFGIPLFALMIVAVYYLTDVAGGFLGDMIEKAVGSLRSTTQSSLIKNGASAWFTSLVCEALIKGVGAVLSFLPQILVLFFLLEIAEECGYLSRAAFLFGGITERAGLGGKAAVALGVSCGCSVNGIMTARTADNENGRRLTVFLCPFMPCGAKTAVFAWFSGLIFGGNPLISASLYFLSIASVVLFGSLLKRLKTFRGCGGMIMEIPNLRLPSMKSVAGAIKEKTVDFILKAGSVIFAVSFAIWIFRHFGLNGYTDDISESFLRTAGEGLKYIFIPLGFGTWQTAVAVVSGVFAKEAIIETLIMVAVDPAALFTSGFAAYAFMAFVLLMPPCAAALAAAKGELRDKRDFLFMIAFQFTAAYAVALTINVSGIAIEKFGLTAFVLTICAACIIILLIKDLRKRATKIVRKPRTAARGREKWAK